MARITKSELIKLQKKLKTDAKIGESSVSRGRRFINCGKIRNRVRHSKNDERNQKIVKSYEGGASGTALSKKFKLSVSQTYRIINETKKSGKKKAAKKKK